MITNAKEVFKTQGWKQKKYYDTDVYFGYHQIRHIKGIMILSDDEYIALLDDVIKTNDDNTDTKIDNSLTGRYVTFSYSLTEPCSLCTSQIEARADALSMSKMSAEKTDFDIRKMVKMITDLNDAIKSKGWEFLCDLGKVVNDNQSKIHDLKIFFQRRTCVFDDEDDCNEEVVLKIIEILKKNKIRITDPGNEDICTTINADNVVSVLINLSQGGRDCIVLQTINNKTYTVFKDDDPDMYTALDFIYQ